MVVRLLSIKQFVMTSLIQIEFVPVSAGNHSKLYNVLVHEKPVIHEIGE